jgi:hypothetical protein
MISRNFPRKKSQFPSHLGSLPKRILPLVQARRAYESIAFLTQLLLHGRHNMPQPLLLLNSIDKSWRT